ncbi:MAG TPA: hypothetical protein VID48_07755 [Solirubrobacteraceae bacterium]|jgi:hypothetical protein
MTTMIHRRGHRKVTLTVGTLTIRVNTGQDAAVALHLNFAGRHLLAAHHTLRVTLTALAIENRVHEVVASRRSIVLHAPEHNG